MKTLRTALISLLNTSNSSIDVNLELLTSDDAAWVLTCSFLILTMQTGFAMLEGGCVSSKNMANIMIKNVIDVSVGGLAYWMVGYGLSYGKPGNGFIGVSDFFFLEHNPSIMGSRYSHYFFQFSFASTATTIISGAVAERMKLHAYMILSLFNVVVYAIPVAWCWSDKGFLKNLGFYDFSGVCVVHLNGGTSALVATLMLGPRRNRFEQPDLFQMSSPVTALTGMFMLTWAWLGFNCGATYGVSDKLWKLSAVVAVCTLNGAIGGGLAGIALSMWHYKFQVRINCVINSILGGLVSITGICGVTTPHEAMLVGALGGSVAIYASWAIERLKIDDPVGSVPVHFAAAVWGTLAVGIFGKTNVVGHLSKSGPGLLHGGNGTLLGVNVLGGICVAGWSAFFTFLILFIVDKIMGIRMSLSDELKGADYTEHNIRHDSVAERLENVLQLLGEEKLMQAFNNVIDRLPPAPNHSERQVQVQIVNSAKVQNTGSATKDYLTAYQANGTAKKVRFKTVAHHLRMAKHFNMP